MGQSVLVFISHSSDDKENLIEPIVADLEASYINVWLDKRKIVPGDNLRKSIFRDGLDKADVALIFFTQNSLKSSWVDKEIKHVLREETKKGNNFDLSKIISIFDTQETYNEISERYPELTDDLLHLMPENYTKIQLCQLVSAIWSKYLSLQGGDIATQKKLLEKDKEIFQKDKEIQQLKTANDELKNKNSVIKGSAEFQQMLESNKLKELIKNKISFLTKSYHKQKSPEQFADAISFGLVRLAGGEDVAITELGKNFFKWYTIYESSKEQSAK